eukprot:TRINITY_DN2251_c0_g1_i13.p1 TRINITY_DN2251_c0_g1~~TRINITY_DN2251_c0_g1_i13.p1  ORF type:complete len:480 (-),score=137.98 TRINITY_DN2251_c0_g1_i13:774-2213(-)
MSHHYLVICRLTQIGSAPEIFGATGIPKSTPEVTKPLIPILNSSFQFTSDKQGTDFMKSTGERKEKPKVISADVEMKDATPKEELKSLVQSTSADSNLQLFSSNLELIKVTKEEIESQALLEHSREDIELVQDFHKHFAELQSQLKTWAANDSSQGSTNGPELILAGCNEYLKVLYSAAAGNSSMSSLINEMEMMLLALVVVHMRLKDIVNCEKLGKLVQCHPQSCKYWNELEKLKAEKKSQILLGKKDGYRSKMAEDAEHYLIEGICTGNYIECQKALESGKIFPKNNARVVQLENLVKELYGRSLSLQGSDAYKRMTEGEYEGSFIFQKEKAKQILRGFQDVPESDKQLQELLETALRILSGDDKAIQHSCKTSFQHIFCYFAYQKPNPTSKQIELLCDTVREKYSVREDSLECRVIEVVAAGGPLDVLARFCGNYPPWFGIHCMDAYNLFLKINGRLSEQMEEEDLPELQFMVLLR